MLSAADTALQVRATRFSSRSRSARRTIHPAGSSARRNSSSGSRLASAALVGRRARSVEFGTSGWRRRAPRRREPSGILERRTDSGEVSGECCSVTMALLPPWICDEVRASAEDGSTTLVNQVEDSHDGDHDRDEHDAPRGVGDQLARVGQITLRSSATTWRMNSAMREAKPSGPPRCGGRPRSGVAVARVSVTSSFADGPLLARSRRSVCPTGRAGQEGLEPPTAGFGDRCSTS